MPANTFKAIRVSWPRKINRVIPALLFLLVLFTPMIRFGHAGPTPSPLVENRRLAEFPRYSIRWFQKLEEWFGDHFGFRNSLIYYGARLHFGLFGLSPNPQVIVGNEGWLFFDNHYEFGKPHLADSRGLAPISANKMQLAIRNLKTINHSLGSCGIKFYFVMAPNKQSIYPDKLPPNLSKLAPDWGDQIFLELKRSAPEVIAIDLREPLMEERRKSNQNLYRKIDTHWNNLGAFVGYREIADRLIADQVIPDRHRSNLDFYSVGQSIVRGGDIADSMMSLPDYFSDTEVTLVGREPTTTVFLGHPEGWPASQNSREYLAFKNVRGNGKLFLYRDSFSEALLPFLTEDFMQTIAVWSYRIDGLQIRKAESNVVVLEVVERYVTELAEAPLNLDQVCANR